jgi:hypothetical protein
MNCCVKRPEDFSVPTPDVKPAANLKSKDYGGIKPIEINTMRQNFIQRITDNLNTPDLIGASVAGGANYVNVQYNNNLQYRVYNPYAKGGFRKYTDAYNSDYCVRSFDEY